MKPFDYDRWKAGDPIRCRDEKYTPTILVEHENKLVVWFNSNTVVAVGRDGRIHWGLQSSFDLFMAEKKHKVWVRLFRWPSEGVELCAILSEQEPDWGDYRYKWCSDPVCVETEEK